MNYIRLSYAKKIHETFRQHSSIRVCQCTSFNWSINQRFFATFSMYSSISKNQEQAQHLAQNDLARLNNTGG
jgi:hypothetical protein